MKSAESRRKDYFLYRVIRFFVKLFSPKMEVTGTENLPEGAAIIVANHSQMYGPIACALPEHRAIPYRNIPKKDYPSNIPPREAKT